MANMMILCLSLITVIGITHGASLHDLEENLLREIIELEETNNELRGEDVDDLTETAKRLNAAMECRDYKCSNGGTCQEHPREGNDFAVCECTEGWGGDHCDDKESTDRCEDMTCQNGGYCRLNARQQPYCRCPGSFTGTACETPNTKKSAEDTVNENDVRDLLNLLRELDTANNLNA